jgi:hypothetical protein
MNITMKNVNTYYCHWSNVHKKFKTKKTPQRELKFIVQTKQTSRERGFLRQSCWF